MSKDGSSPRSLRITGTGRPGGTQVELDGQDISRALRGVTLRLDTEHRPTAVLDIDVHDLDADTAETHIAIPEPTRALLTRLGWTPPAGEAH